MNQINTSMPVSALQTRFPSLFDQYQDLVLAASRFLGVKRYAISNGFSQLIQSRHGEYYRVRLEVDALHQDSLSTEETAFMFSMAAIRKKTRDAIDSATTSGKLAEAPYEVQKETALREADYAHLARQMARRELDLPDDADEETRHKAERQGIWKLFNEQVALSTAATGLAICDELEDFSQALAVCEQAHEKCKKEMVRARRQRLTEERHKRDLDIAALSAERDKKLADVTAYGDWMMDERQAARDIFLAEIGKDDACPDGTGVRIRRAVAAFDSFLGSAIWLLEKLS